MATADKRERHIAEVLRICSERCVEIIDLGYAWRLRGPRVDLVVADDLALVNVARDLRAGR